MEQLVHRILQGDRRATAKAITLLEDQGPDRHELLQSLHPHTGKAYIVGITGPPGAGKSTLTDQLLHVLRREGRKVGVIAVDPTSPFTGGAILGDRVRMMNHALDPGVFIRSMGTRGSLGGLSRATKEAIRVLDAYGSDIILIETVGVGQSELDIMHAADTTVVVLNPSAGDQIQTLKAGIMEIADVFVINKADLPRADKTEREINDMLDLIQDFDWRPLVIKTTSRNAKTFEALWQACKDHKAHQQSTNQWMIRRQRRFQDEILQIMEEKFRNRVKQWFTNAPDWDKLRREAEAWRANPYHIADTILEWYNTSTCD